MIWVGKNLAEQGVICCIYNAGGVSGHNVCPEAILRNLASGMETFGRNVTERQKRNKKKNRIGELTVQ